MREVRSSWSLKMSPSDSCEVWDQTSVQPGASTSCVLTRSCSPARSRVPVNTMSTPASPAIVFRSWGLAGESRRDDAGSDDQRVEPGEGAGDGVGQAEGEKVGLRVGAQNPERHHDEAGHVWSRRWR